MRVVVPLALLLVGRNAAAASEPVVVVAHAEPALDAVAQRVRAELLSAGRGNVTLERRAELGSCGARAADEERVEVLLQPGDAGAVVAEICAPAERDPGGAVTVSAVTVSGQLRDDGEFAIVVTEALHGLLLAAEKHGAAPGAEPPPKRSEPERDSDAKVTLSIGSRLAVDLPTGGVFLGVVPELHMRLGRHLWFGAEAFVGVLPVEYSDAQMALESQLIWARFGLLGKETVGPLSLGWYLSVGPYANRATATAVPPRVGGSDGAFGAMIAAGGQAEFPARGHFYVSSTLGLSTLVPRLAYQMSEEVTPEVGQLLFEGGLGLGFRFGR